MQFRDIKSEEVCEYLQNRFHIMTYSVTEEGVSRIILAKPEDVAEQIELVDLLGKDYIPGTFYLSEREDCPRFLFDEEIKNFKEWLYYKMKAEVDYLKTISDLQEEIIRIGEEKLILYAMQILFFKTDNGLRICDVVTNQEYSDLFCKILLFLINGNSRETYNVFEQFNSLGLRLSLAVLKLTENYSLEQRLYQSIYSGLIGLDIKDYFGSTSKLGNGASINLKYSNSIIDTQIVKELEQKMAINMRLNDWSIYFREVIRSDEKRIICWFADDYIPTVFEMKFIEEQLLANDNLSFILVPRAGYYSNDICYTDVFPILNSDIFARLKDFYQKGRFIVSEFGMDLGAFNGNRIRSGLLRQINISKTIVISGARSFEMAQGLNKDVYFSGIAVCRKYTEAVTGIDMNTGEGVFLHAAPCAHLFSGFRYRSPCHPYAKRTVLSSRVS